eukprot:7388245-Pyramimonas_sp.AAC.1
MPSRCYRGVIECYRVFSSSITLDHISITLISSFIELASKLSLSCRCAAAEARERMYRAAVASEAAAAQLSHQKPRGGRRIRGIPRNAAARLG